MEVRNNGLTDDQWSSVEQFGKALGSLPRAYMVYTDAMPLGHSDPTENKLVNKAKYTNGQLRKQGEYVRARYFQADVP